MDDLSLWLMLLEQHREMIDVSYLICRDDGTGMTGMILVLNKQHLFTSWSVSSSFTHSSWSEVYGRPDLLTHLFQKLNARSRDRIISCCSFDWEEMSSSLAQKTTSLNGYINSSVDIHLNHLDCTAGWSPGLRAAALETWPRIKGPPVAVSNHAAI